GSGSGAIRGERMRLLEVTGLHTEIVTREAGVRPVDGVTFSIGKGEILGLVGESGSGKTMTGMSIMRLLPAGGSITAGSVKFDGVELTALDGAGLRRPRGHHNAPIPPDPETPPNPNRATRRPRRRGPPHPTRRP